jgi:hypothetical protein
MSVLFAVSLDLNCGKAVEGRIKNTISKSKLVFDRKRAMTPDQIQEGEDEDSLCMKFRFRLRFETDFNLLDPISNLKVPSSLSYSPCVRLTPKTLNF